MLILTAQQQKAVDEGPVGMAGEEEQADEEVA